MSTHKIYSVKVIHRLIVATVIGWTFGVISLGAIVFHFVHATNKGEVVKEEQKQTREDIQKRIDALLEEKRMSKLRGLIRENNRRLSYAQADLIARTETHSAIEHGIDPEIMYAISMQESRWNTDAATWCCEGIRQLNYYAHKDWLLGGVPRHKLNDPVFNIKKGTELFAHLLKRYGSYEVALQRYYGSTDPAKNVWYMKEVLAKKSYIGGRIA